MSIIKSVKKCISGTKVIASYGYPYRKAGVSGVEQGPSEHKPQWTAVMFAMLLQRRLESVPQKLGLAGEYRKPNRPASATPRVTITFRPARHSDSLLALPNDGNHAGSKAAAALLTRNACRFAGLACDAY